MSQSMAAGALSQTLFKKLTAHPQTPKLDLGKRPQKMKGKSISKGKGEGKEQSGRETGELVRMSRGINAPGYRQNNAKYWRQLYIRHWQHTFLCTSVIIRLQRISFLTKNWRKDENWPSWRKYWFWRNLTKLVNFWICGKLFDEICTFWRTKNGINWRQNLAEIYRKH